MADITKCKDDECPLKEYCYRYMAEPNEHWQSYFVNSPRNGKECEMFWGEIAQIAYDTLLKIVQ